MRFIYDNLAVIYVALVASLMAWVFGGTRGGLLVPLVPWLMLFMLEIIFIFPQKYELETTREARQRVWRKMKKDPLVWTAVGFLALLAIPFVNNGLCPGCDAELIAQGVKAAPPAKFLPFCVDRMDHLNVFLWFVTALSAMIATKHCLRRRGKRLLLEMIVWNGFALAILGFVQNATGAPGPLWVPMKTKWATAPFFSTFGYANMAGDYFTTLFGLSAALWRHRYEAVRTERNADNEHDSGKVRGVFWRKNYLLIPAAVFFFAALNTLSRAAILLVSALAVLFFLHAFVSFLSRMSKARRVKSGTLSLFVLGVIVFSASVFAPREIRKEVDSLDANGVLDRVTSKGQYHARVATEVWRDNILFGCGGWGYKHFCITKMTEAELKSMQDVGGTNVHNDYLQFLAEHGVVGLGALVALVVLLVAPVGSVWRKLIAASRFAKPRDKPPRPVQIFALPAPVFSILLTALATFIHGFGDCPFRSPAVLTLFYVMLAAMPGFLPKLPEAPAK